MTCVLPLNQVLYDKEDLKVHVGSKRIYFRSTLHGSSKHGQSDVVGAAVQNLE